MSATVYVLLGDPVAHSRSPELHNAAFRALGIDAVYVPLRVAADAAPQLLRALTRAGGGGNVTLPHKQLAAAALDAPSDAVLRTGACNTFWAGPRGVHGENTDVGGFLAAARHHGVELRGARVLLLGAGGAAAGVLAALESAAASRVTLANRSPERAAALAQRYQGPWLHVAPLPADLSVYDVIVNATSLGLRPADPHPLRLDRIPAGCTLLDLVYASGGTAWVRAARARELRAFDGTELLLRQAAAAFHCWTQREAPLDVMRAALAAE